MILCWKYYAFPFHFLLTVGDGASGRLSSKHQTENGNNPGHVDAEVAGYAGMNPNGNPLTEYGLDYYGHGKKR